MTFSSRKSSRMVREEQGSDAARHPGTIAPARYDHAEFPQGVTAPTRYVMPEFRAITTLTCIHPHALEVTVVFETELIQFPYGTLMISAAEMKSRTLLPPSVLYDMLDWRRGIPTRGQVLKERGLLSPNQAVRVQNHWTRNAIAAIVYSPEYSGWHLNYHSVSSYNDTPHPLTGLPRSRPQRRQLLRRAETAYLPLAELREQYGEFLMPVPALVDEDIQQAAMARFTYQSHARQSSPAPDAKNEGGRHVPREDALLAGG